MRVRRPHFRPTLEVLESRETPANFTVSFSALAHTLTITGDSLNNNLKITGVGGDATKFSLSSATDTFNSLPGPLVTPSGVKNISIKLLDGDDAVTFANTVPVKLQGNLSIQGGPGANNVTSMDLTVQKNFSITNGSNSTGSDANTLENLNVGGALTINNGSGNTNTSIHRSSAGLSFLVGNVSITNGVGQDFTEFYDMNFGGNVTVKNGNGSAGGTGGTTWIYNFYNTTARSTIKGSVNVSYLDGNGGAYDGIWDMNVLGNVTYNHGPGSFVTNLDGYQTTLPVQIQGNLTFLGTGANQITVGTQYNHTGLILGKNLTVTTGGAADTLTFNKLQVNGATKLSLGNGNNTVNIDDSLFLGTFTLTTGSGTDSVFLDHATGTTAPTVFYQSVLMTQGAGGDQVVRAGGTDANQQLIILGTFVVHHGTGAGDSTTSTAGHEVFPFLTSIVWAV